MEDFDIKLVKRLFIWFIAVSLVVSAIIWFANRATQTADNAIVHYEDFHEIYTTCQKINADLGTLRAIPDSDPMFAQFSKSAQVAGKKQQLTRWVEEYNAKSKMWNRSLWKSKELPYQLSTNDFSNYEGGAK
jgi:hypothetical protein